MVWRKLNLAAIIEQVPIGVVVTRLDGRIEYANPHFHALIEARNGALHGRDLATLRCDGAGPHDGGRAPGESRLRTSTGGAIHVSEAVYPLHGKDGAVACFIHFLQDLSAQKHAELLSTLAFYDSLTGLPNRNLFEDQLARAVLAAERRGVGFALLYIDIDQFKEINDTWGHDAGDRLLRETAARTSRALRKSDILARLGGDEFAAILDGVVRRADACNTARKLLALCGEHYELNNSRVRATLSVGISLCPQDGRDAATLLKQADRAMYSAKEGGRNRFCLVAKRHDLALDAD